MSFQHNIYVGKKIREERIRRNWSQLELSEHTGISKSHIGTIERGKSDPTVGNLVKIANAFHVSVDYFVYPEIDSGRSSSVIHRIMDDCSEYEKQIISESILALKSTLRKVH